MSNIKKRKPSKLNRRHFLQMTSASVLGFSSIKFIENFADHFIAKAYADSAKPSKAIISFIFAGAPNSYQFLGTMNPNNSPLFKANPLVVSAHDKNHSDPLGSNPKLIYKTFSHPSQGGQVQLPILWDKSVVRPDGSMAPLKNLLPQTGIIQGMDMGGVDSHEVCLRKLVNPNEQYSLHGLASDSHTSPISTLLVGAGPSLSAYKAQKTSPIAVNNLSNPISSIMQAFQSSSSDQHRKIASVKSAVDLAIDKIREHSDQLQQFYGSNFTDRENAEDLLISELGNFQQIFGQLKSKYENLLTKATEVMFKAPYLSDITDQLISPSAMIGTFPKTFDGNVSNIFTLMNLMPEIFHQQWDGGGATEFLLYPRNQDYRQIFYQQNTVNVKIESMAAHFALCEYMITHQYAQSLVHEFSNMLVIGHKIENYLAFKDLNISYNPVDNKTVVSIKPGSPSDLGLNHIPSFVWASDSHLEGVYPSYYNASFLWYSFATCLYELVEQIKSHNLFDDVVIHVGSEFTRSGRTEGSGSDHGIWGNQNLVLNGEIKKLFVIGDLFDTPPSNKGLSGYPGTWGYGAPVTNLGGPGIDRQVDAGNLAATLARMIGCASPSPNSVSLVTYQATTGWNATIPQSTIKKAS